MSAPAAIGLIIALVLLGLLVAWWMSQTPKVKLPSYTVKHLPITSNVLYLLAQELCDVAARMDRGLLEVEEDSGVAFSAIWTQGPETGDFIDINLRFKRIPPPPPTSWYEEHA